MNRACDQWCQKASALLLGANRSPDIGVQMLIAVKESRKSPVSIPLRDRLQKVLDDGCRPFCMCNGYNDGQQTVFCRVCQRGFHVACM